MSAVLEILWAITLGSLLTAGMIILIRILFRNILSAKAKYYLWLLLALRLMLPSLPESPTSLMNLIPDKAEIPQPIMVETADSAAPTDTEPLYLVPGSPAEPALEIEIDRQVNPENGTEVVTAWAFCWDDVIVVLWGIGVAVTLLVFIILYLLTGRNLKKLPHCTDPDTLRLFVELRKALAIRREIRLVSGSGGMSGGLFRPTIVIPAEQHGEDLKPILLHELMHIRARDLWLMAFYRLLCALNWFNPIVWLCFHRANLDSEAACDQRVLETELVEKSDYAEVLYRESLLKSTDGLYFRTAFGGGKHAIRDRIRQITRFAGKKTWMIPLVLVLAVVVSACTLTGKDSSESAASEISQSSSSPAALPSITDSTQSSILDIPWDSTPDEVMALLELDSENTLNFQNCQWGMTPEEVISTLGLGSEQYKLTNKGQNYHLVLDDPVSDHPEVKKIDFTFHYIDLDLTLGLDNVEITYDKELLAYDELVAARITQLGDPTSVFESGTSWENYDETWLTIGEGNNLWERLIFTERPELTDLLVDFDIEEYMSPLHPPGGHYGWSYQEHINNGLLLPEDGLYTDHGDGTHSYITTIELGGHELPATYWFTPSVLTYNSGVDPVLREVHVDIPEAVQLSLWIASFSDSFTNRLWQNSTYSYKTPISVGSFLTEEQKEAIDQAFYSFSETGGSTESWPLATNWYDSSAWLWKFNATGYTLYLDAMDLSE